MGGHTGDGSREQDFAAALRDHVADHVLGQVDRGNHVEMNQVYLLFQVGFGGETAPHADPGIQRNRGHGATGGTNDIVKRVYTVAGSQVRLYGLDLRAQPFEVGCGFGEGYAVGSDDQIEPILGKLLGEFKANSAGSTSDNGEGTGSRSVH